MASLLLLLALPMLAMGNYTMRWTYAGSTNCTPGLHPPSPVYTKVTSCNNINATECRPTYSGPYSSESYSESCVPSQ
jgi:hypothetical protein